MAWGDWLARWRLDNGPPLLKWPKQAMADYGGWFLFALFAAILVWEVREADAGYT